MKISCAHTAIVAGLAGLAVSHAAAGVVPASIVIQEGAVIDGSPITGLNAPFTNGLGQVGLLAILEDGRRAVLVDGAPLFLSSDALPDDLSGGEGTMGIGDNGEFIYSPSFNGGDSVYGENGVIAEDDAPAFDFTAGFNMTFHSRPRMLPDGSSYWISGTNDGMGGTSTQNRIIYLRNAGSGNIFGILRAGDNVGGAIVASAGGIDFDNAISDDASNFLFVFNDALGGGTASDGTLAVNNAIIAREASPTGDGDNWDNFDATSINNSGNYAFSGDTDGATTADEFIAYNGSIVLREGDAFGAGSLAGSVNALSLNNNGEAVFVWGFNDGLTTEEALFYASDASDMPGTTQMLLRVGDSIDTTGDGIADFTVTDFNASAGIGPGLDLADDGRVHAEVDLVPSAGGVEFEAIITLDLNTDGPCNLADLADAFGVLDLDDVNAFVTGFLASDGVADVAAPFGVWDLADVSAFVAAFLAGCP